MLLLNQYALHLWGSILNLADLGIPGARRSNTETTTTSALQPQPNATPSPLDETFVDRSASQFTVGAHTVRLETYESLIELRKMLENLEQDPVIPRSTILLVLDRQFSGHLPSLIQRSRAGSRLVLIVENGHVPLPGPVTVADLIARERSLGWDQIVFERDIERAVSTSLETLEDGEPLMILRPVWQYQTIPLLLQQRFACPVTPLTLREISLEIELS